MTQPLMLDPHPPLPPPARLGEVLGKYRLDRILATGGMGVVVAATHLELGQRIAIKFMSPLLADDSGGIRRFMLEARSAAHLRSEHVVRVFDVDRLPSGTPYIVMEYLEGEDLSVMLGRRGWLRPAEAVDYVLQACEAIAEAHVVGIVHRDLKPGNLFCCRRPDGGALVKVLDFGVSKLLPRADAELRSGASTGPHVVMGTPTYASPEQLRSSTRVDARTDIWSLGVILYELVAGRPPFRADTFLALCAKVTHASLQPLHELRPEVPPELDAVVARCLAKEREERFQTVAELADALAPFAPRRALISVERVEHIVHANVASTGLEPTLPSASSVRPTASPSVAKSRGGGPARSRPLRVVLGSVAGGAAGGALIGAWIALTSVPGVPPASLARPAAAASVRVVVPAPAPASASASAPAPASASASAFAPASASAPAPTSPKRPPVPRQAPGTAGFGGLL